MKEVRIIDKSGLGRRLGALLLLAGCPVFFSACTPSRINPESQYVSVEHPARIPAGVIRYCWEEPIVQFEPNGPGLDEEERWYRPSYLAVQEVRQGKWRPCRPVPSEVKGETKNER